MKLITRFLIRPRASLALIVAFLILGLVVGQAGAAPARWTRDEEPVILSGDRLAAWTGVSLDDLFLYAFHEGEGWRQIPWQFDEQDDSDRYVSAEDGRLDANDELAFWSGDCGERAQEDAWLEDGDARTHIRYEIQVTDPLSAQETCWVYLYRSATLTVTHTRDDVAYADYTASSHHYHLTLKPHKIIADALTLGDREEDVLDRTKVRARVGFFSKTEDTLDTFGADSDWVLTQDGPIRTIVQFTDYRGDDTRTLITFIGYRSMFLQHVTYPVETWSQLDEFRYSVDMTEAMIGATYYDANTRDGVPVDGEEDSVTVTPFSAWQQISHPTLGSLVQVVDIAMLGGTQETYYQDNGDYVYSDTGDHRTYADGGFRVRNCSAHLDFYVYYFVLSPGQPNVGAIYAARVQHPLRVQTARQSYSSPKFKSFFPMWWNAH